MDRFYALRKYAKEGRELAVIAVKGFYPETREDVAGRIRRFLNVWPAEKLCVNPDCGVGWSPRGMCNGKIATLASGIRIVREELGGA